MSMASPLPSLPGREKSASQTPSLPDTNPTPILEFCDTAPSPNQTYFQLCVFPYKPTPPKTARPSKATEDKKLVLNRDKIKKGCVVLRDWPKKRMSQHWKRDGLVNPSETVISFDDFVGGEMDSELIAIFGKDRYDKCLVEVKKQIAIRDMVSPTQASPKK